MKLHDVAVVGATGLVGRKMIQVLEERKFPVGRLVLLASERSTGHEMRFNGNVLKVQPLTPESFKDVDIALFSAGGAVSLEYCPIAAKHGAVAIDNSSAWRMDEDVPLVVPEVNRKDIFKHKGIIANPNCSTIQMVVVLKPLHDAFHIKRVVVSTYQSVTGAGKRGMDQLTHELAHQFGEKKFPHPIAYNVIPHIDIFYEDGSTKEELKMVNETKKILGANIPVSATTVRVPVIGGHSESVNIEFEKPCTPERIREILRSAAGIVVQDDPKSNLYPMPMYAHERDEVFVGRIRKDPTVTSGINLWIVADNLRKGAATNAVQIGEVLAQGR
ncbi:MAG: aspartate-semialdehyde dehydrogenase [Ignavibacteriales bacterium]|nr:aspartate-semialdehyde dehydrogenase [Ignavibacteriales bacterium]